MGTWISHLRIAEQVLHALPELDEVAFTFGSLAPDSGVPVAGAEYRFEPPKEITHFLNSGDDEDRIRDLEFYRGYVAPIRQADERVLYSFCLGYFFHLIADNLWALHMIRTHKKAYTALFEQKGDAAWWDFKRDWYDLDHKYLRDHRESLFWRVFLGAQNPPCYLPFLSEDSLYSQLDRIRELYTSDDPERVLDRLYPYLNEATMNRYVREAVRAILYVHQYVNKFGAPDAMPSAIVLLPAADREPYEAPIGDVMS